MGLHERPAKELCRGRWSYLLPLMGVPAQFLKNKHGPCPKCGGKDRFRWDDRDGRGTYYCSNCGPGDGFQLAELVTGKRFKDLFAMVEANIGTAPMPDVAERPSAERLRERQQFVWDRGYKPAEGGAVHLYQTRRLGRLWQSSEIREVAGIRHPSGEILPAMVARVTGPGGDMVNVHITYLTLEGEKAPVDPPRRVMQGELPEGSAVRIWPAAERMGVAEGIETAMAAAAMFRMPVWACLNAGMLQRWTAPAGMKHITIFADADKTFTGEAAAFSLARRLAMQQQIPSRVMIPAVQGQDWADRPDGWISHGVKWEDVRDDRKGKGELV